MVRHGEAKVDKAARESDPKGTARDSRHRDMAATRGTATKDGKVAEKVGMVAKVGEQDGTAKEEKVMASPAGKTPTGDPRAGLQQRLL